MSQPKVANEKNGGGPKSNRRFPLKSQQNIQRVAENKFMKTLKSMFTRKLP